MSLHLESILENRKRSPYTGWTREHWVHLAEKLIGGYLDTLDETTFMPVIGDRLPMNPHLETCAVYAMEEFFDRHLIMAAAWLKGTGVTRAPGWKHDLAESYRNAILLGTTEDSAHPWGPLAPHSAFGNGLAMAILIAPEYFWEPFTPEQQMNIGRFMKRLAVHSSHDNNHWYFHLAAVPILDRCGIAYDAAYFAEKWDRLIGWYRGDGWYLDGSNDAYDYYNHWGFHYFNLLLYSGCETWRNRYGEHIREATRAFLTTYPLFFSAEGSSVPWGRSLVYRHALLAPLVWAEYAGISPLSPGLSRRIASGNLRYFFQDNGKAVLSNDDLLIPGYLELNPNLLETYNDQGSGYWSSTAFIALALPPEHPFWTADEEALPADEGQSVLRRIDGPKFLLHQQAGRARLFCFEQPRKSPAWQLSIKYGQHVFDGALGFGLVGEAGTDPGFNRVGYRFENSPWYYRQRTVCEELQDAYGISSWAVCEGAVPYAPEVGRMYQCTIPGEGMDIHLVYHTCPTPLHLSMSGLCINSQGESRELRSFEMSEERQIGVATSQGFSAIAQIGACPGRFNVGVVAPEYPAFASHLLGGTGVFPRWEGDSAIAPHQTLVFACRAGGPDAPATVDPADRIREASSLLESSAFPCFRESLV